MKPPLRFGLTALLMGNTRWKLSWHFYAHCLGQMFGRTRCYSCFLPASPTTEQNTKHAHWSHWKLLAVSWGPGGCSQLLIHWVLLCWLLLWYRFASSTCGNIPWAWTIHSNHWASFLWVDTCNVQMNKNNFSNQALETVCLCLSQAFVFPLHKYVWPLLEKKVLKKKSGKQFRHSCFCFSLTYLMFLLVPLGERKRLSFCISWLFPSVSLPPHFSHLLLCRNACCTIYFCNV